MKAFLLSPHPLRVQSDSGLGGREPLPRFLSSSQQIIKGPFGSWTDAETGARVQLSLIIETTHPNTVLKTLPPLK